MNVAALVMAGGKGTRMAVSVEKPLLMLNGVPIIGHVINALKNSKKVGSIFVAVSDNTPKTADYVVNFQVEVIKTPGTDYVSDLGYAIRNLKLQTVLAIGADLPLITGEIVDDIIEKYFSFGKPTLAVAVPLETKKSLGLGMEYEFEVDHKRVVPAGINVIDGLRIDEKELDQAIYVLDRKEVAVNINTSHDLGIAHELVG